MAAKETGRLWWIGQPGKARPLASGVYLLDPLADGLEQRLEKAGAPAAWPQLGRQMVSPG